MGKPGNEKQLENLAFMFCVFGDADFNDHNFYFHSSVEQLQT